MVDAKLPIGVFDSGMGGLTVLRALQAAMPGESFIYLGDSARLPYGNKTTETVQEYALQASAALVERGIKALVIACNTASAAALPLLVKTYAPLPVFGVIEPGAQAAASVAADAEVLVLATEGTVMDGTYQRALLAANPDLSVYARACPLWVTLAEQGYAEDSQESGMVADAVLSHALRGFRHRRLVLLLGCTHFPVFRHKLAALLGDAAVIVDSAQTTALQVAEALKSDNAGASGDVTFLATDGAERFRRVGAYFLGKAIGAVELVKI